MTEPRIIPVGQEPPPMTPQPSKTRRTDKPKGTTAAGRFKVLNTFIDFTMGGLSRNDMAVWLVLFRDTKDGLARTSEADIARRSGVSDRTVRRCIGRLRKRGLVCRVRRGGLLRGAGVYRVHPLEREPTNRTELCPVA